MSEEQQEEFADDDEQDEDSNNSNVAIHESVRAILKRVDSEKEQR